MLKEIEASGFDWVQLPAPPASVLANPRNCIQHARAADAALCGTGLRRVLHAPGELLAGEPEADRALTGALSYAAECGAELVVYHARALPDGPVAEDRLLAETRSLAAIAPIAERSRVTLALENLAPVFPGPETVSANPLAVRALARRIGSPAVGLCLDVGHANVVAGLRRTSLTRMVEPVLDLVALFHLHDNLGARWRPADQRPDLDPLRLDLHLPPGRGSIDWSEVAHRCSPTTHPSCWRSTPHAQARRADGGNPGSAGRRAVAKAGSPNPRARGPLTTPANLPRRRVAPAG